MTETPTQQTKSKKQPPWYYGCLFLIICLLFFGLVVIGLMADDEPTDSGSTPAASKPTRAAPKPVQRKTVTESCFEVSKKFGTGSDLSDLQKDEAWKQYKGGQFKWDLEVVEVSAAMFGGFTVTYKCSPKSPSLLSDLMLSYEDNAKAAVIALKKGHIYEVNGVLKSTGTLLGLSGDGVFE